MRRVGIVLVIAAALLLAACGGGDDKPKKKSTTTTTSTTTTSSSTTTTTTAPATTTTAAPNTTCQNSSLAASITEGSPGAGQRYATVVFTNNGSTMCTMTGYIGMQLLASNGSDIPTDVVRTPGNVTTVTLPPGGMASTLLQWGAINGEGDDQNGPCQPTATQVELTAPNNTASLTQPWTFGPVCEAGTINVIPVVAGANPQP